MSMDYIVPSLYITTVTNMEDNGIMEERLAQLLDLEEDQFITIFHQQVQKERDKAWHDRHINKNRFKDGDLVLLYDKRFAKFTRKLQCTG